MTPEQSIPVDGCGDAGGRCPPHDNEQLALVRTLAELTEQVAQLRTRAGRAVCVAIRRNDE